MTFYLRITLIFHLLAKVSIPSSAFVFALTLEAMVSFFLTHLLIRIIFFEEVAVKRKMSWQRSSRK